jgi:oligoribonuclease NrnB/cAMP/cGMP phosphodiesterase (DHH superfamily)
MQQKQRFKAFYHSKDCDGQACGALIRDHYKKAMLVPIDHGDPFPMDLIGRNDVVGFFDWFPDDFGIIEEVLNRAAILWIIDHHVSTRKIVSKHNLEERLKEPSFFITDSDINQEAACELTYKWLKNTEQVPYYLGLLGRYDVWDHTDPNTLPFQYAARAWLDDPRKDIQKWKRLIYTSKPTDTEFMEGLIAKGKLIMEYERKQAAKEMERYSFETEIQGYKAIAINRPYSGSKFFESVYNPKKHDLMLSYAWDGRQWNLSFYTDKPDVNVSDIARSYGGGGHQNAAGGQVSELPFNTEV